MKSTKFLAMLVLVLSLLISVAGVKAQVTLGTAFTYQGFLMDKNNPADGTYDFEFSLYDDPNVGAPVGSTVFADDLNVDDGHFKIELDFGSGIFTGDARWLETAVRQGSSSDPCDFVTLSPRLEVTLSPYAIYAKTAGAVPGGITGSGITNNIPIFIDSNTLTQSVIYESGGSIGIGLMNPSQRLDVAGVIRVVADNPTFLFYDVNAPSDDRYFMMRGSNQDLNFISLLGNMEFEQRVMIIKSTGNVGIGTTSPTEKLEVNGNLKVTGNIIGGLKTYDSGWFAISSGENLSKTHDLGTTKVLTRVYGATSSTGANMGTMKNTLAETPLVSQITTTTCVLHVGADIGQLWNGSAYATPTHARIIMVALE